MANYAVLTYDYLMDCYADVSEMFENFDSAVDLATGMYEERFERGTDFQDFEIAIMDLRGDWVPVAHFEFDRDDPYKTLHVVRNSHDLADYL